MSGHTPAPWRVYIDYEDGNPISIDTGLQGRGPQSRTICTFPPYIKRDETALANARLIEKAPETAAELERVREINAELVEALKECEEYFDQRADAEYLPGQAAPQGNEEMGLLTDVRAAIAKATPNTATGDDHGD